MLLKFCRSYKTANLLHDYSKIVHVCYSIKTTNDLNSKNDDDSSQIDSTYVSSNNTTINIDQTSLSSKEKSDLTVSKALKDDVYPWFRNKKHPHKSNLFFSCVQCGRCCKGRSRTQVYLSEAEIIDISSYMGMNDREFLQEYTYTVQNPTAISLKSKVITESCNTATAITNVETEKKIGTKSDQLACVFLDEKTNQCQIYEVRPTQCRSYPFWSNHLIGEAEWQTESIQCKGITTKLSSSSKTKTAVEAAAVDYENVVLNMTVKDVHNYGVGEMSYMTYDEMIDTLTEVYHTSDHNGHINSDTSDNDNDNSNSNTAATTTAVNIISENIQDFINTNESTVVYENEYLRVVDTVQPVESSSPPHIHTNIQMNNINNNAMFNTSNSSDDMYTFKTSDELLQKIDNNLDVNSSNNTITYRRLEFLNTLHMIQSKALLHNKTNKNAASNECEINHSVIALPIHKIITNLIMQYLQNIYPALHSGISNTSSSPSSTSTSTSTELRMGVLGAGGCILPNHLYHLLSPHLINNHNNNNNNNINSNNHQNTTTTSKFIKRLRIDCVDPDTEILEIAQAFFDTSFINTIPSTTNTSAATANTKLYDPYNQQNTKQNIKKSGLIQYPCTGEEFMKRHVSEICVINTNTYSWSDSDNTTTATSTSTTTNSESSTNEVTALFNNNHNEYEYDVLIIDAYDSTTTNTDNSHVSQNNNNDNEVDDMVKLSTNNQKNNTKNNLQTKEKHIQPKDTTSTSTTKYKSKIQNTLLKTQEEFFDFMNNNTDTDSDSITTEEALNLLMKNNNSNSNNELDINSLNMMNNMTNNNTNNSNTINQQQLQEAVTEKSILDHLNNNDNNNDSADVLNGMTDVEIQNMLLEQYTQKTKVQQVHKLNGSKRANNQTQSQNKKRNNKMTSALISIDNNNTATEQQDNDDVDDDDDNKEVSLHVLKMNNDHETSMQSVNYKNNKSTLKNKIVSAVTSSNTVVGSNNELSSIHNHDDDDNDDIVIHLTAPPLSLIDQPELLFASLKLKTGILVINIYGTKSWLTGVHHKIAPVAHEYEYKAPVYFQLMSQQEFDNTNTNSIVNNNNNNNKNDVHLNYLYCDKHTMNEQKNINNSDDNTDNSAPPPSAVDDDSLTSLHRHVSEEINRYNYIMVCYPSNYESTALSQLIDKAAVTTSKQSIKSTHNDRNHNSNMSSNNSNINVCVSPSQSQIISKLSPADMYSEEMREIQEHNSASSHNSISHNISSPIIITLPI